MLRISPGSIVSQNKMSGRCTQEGRRDHSLYELDLSQEHAPSPITKISEGAGRFTRRVELPGPRVTTTIACAGVIKSRCRARTSSCWRGARNKANEWRWIFWTCTAWREENENRRAKGKVRYAHRMGEPEQYLATGHQGNRKEERGVCLSPPSSGVVTLFVCMCWVGLLAAC